MRRQLVALALVVSFAGTSLAGPDLARIKKTRTDAVNFLRTTQEDDGSWTTSNSPGVSGLVLFSLLENGLPVDDPTVAKGLKHLESFIRDDGGVYAKDSKHRNYETCISLLVFARADEAIAAKGKEGNRYTKQIAAAEKFLKDIQWDKGEGIEDSDVNWGGAGYGGGGNRPDLSNTAFLVQALKEAGVKADDPAMQAALKFVSRTQNLESEHNQTEHAAKINDGGFYYTPSAGGQTKAGTTENGGLRSYGSMTYAGLKSMIYCGLTPEDPRVQAALEWAAKNYTLEENPGMGQTGKFYYFHTLAKTLGTLGKDTFVDGKGVEHDWRSELVAKLAELQKENGAWINEAERWYEGDPNLATAYGLMALAYCEPEAE